MFTGLVQAVGRIVESRRNPGGVLRLVVDTGGWDHRPSLGDSIAVNGCCLTVVAARAGTLSFDVVAQTQRVTTLAGLATGSGVNLEHAVTAGTYLGGHVVQGHVDGVGRVVANGPAVASDTAAAVGGSGQSGSEGDWRLVVQLPQGLARYMLPRGSVCIEGVSLTLAEVRSGGEQIECALIPATLEMTTLRELSAGAGVNIEADAMVKAVVFTVERVMEKRR